MQTICPRDTTSLVARPAAFLGCDVGDTVCLTTTAPSDSCSHDDNTGKSHAARDYRHGRAAVWRFGVMGVSIRQIGLEAKAANNSAINYHFGDRAGLVRAIWADRLPVLDRMRAGLLEQVEASGGAKDPAQVMGALMLPTFLLVDGEGYHRYAAFFRSVMGWKKGAHCGCKPWTPARQASARSTCCKDWRRTLRPNC
jgi:hypothetical protein